VIPNDALGNLQGQHALVLLLHDGKIKRQQVTVGLQGLALSEIVAGLTAGDQVLADASSTLAVGSRVHAVVQKAPVDRPTLDPATRNELPVKFN
jgi:HlyD family secretion protein